MYQFIEKQSILTSINNSQKTEKTASVETSESQTNIDEETPQGEDCFRKFGIVSSLEKRTSNSEFDDGQPAKLTEHIDTITALLIYHTYSRKHQSKSSRRYRTQSIRDDLDRFDVLYSCLRKHNKHSTKSTPLNHVLRDRFFTLKKIKKLHEFEQNEQSRLSDEKRSYLHRVPYIPNISSYQRRCPYYSLVEMEWIRDHLC